MLDLIELNDSKYVELNFTQGYIFFAYQPCNHLIFTKFMTAKTCENTVSALEDMFKYLDDQDNKVEINYINRATFDEGSEFKGEF